MRSWTLHHFVQCEIPIEISDSTTSRLARHIGGLFYCPISGITKIRHPEKFHLIFVKSAPEIVTAYGSHPLPLGYRIGNIPIPKTEIQSFRLMVVARATITQRQASDLISPSPKRQREVGRSDAWSKGETSRKQRTCRNLPRWQAHPKGGSR